MRRSTLLTFVLTLVICMVGIQAIATIPSLVIHPVSTVVVRNNAAGGTQAPTSKKFHQNMGPVYLFIGIVITIFLIGIYYAQLKFFKIKRQKREQQERSNRRRASYRRHEFWRNMSPTTAQQERARIELNIRRTSSRLSQAPLANNKIYIGLRDTKEQAKAEARRHEGLDDLTIDTMMVEQLPVPNPAQAR